MGKMIVGATQRRDDYQNNETGPRRGKPGDADVSALTPASDWG